MSQARQKSSDEGTMSRSAALDRAVLRVCSPHTSGRHSCYAYQAYKVITKLILSQAPQGSPLLTELIALGRLGHYFRKLIFTE